MRVMGLDYGSKTVGVAVSDENGVVALPKETIKRDRENKVRRTLAKIEELVEEYGVGAFVVGYPKHMDDSIGERVQKVEWFAEELRRRTKIEVEFWDERLTTRSANEILKETGVRREDRKAYLDPMAAAILLQGYLDYRNKESVDGGEHGTDRHNE